MGKEDQDLRKRFSGKPLDDPEFRTRSGMTTSYPNQETDAASAPLFTGKLRQLVAAPTPVVRRRRSSAVPARQDHAKR
jgi:hypothetical protein